jgi:hypothetical protein
MDFLSSPVSTGTRARARCTIGFAAARSALPDVLAAKRGPYSFFARSSSATPRSSNLTAPTHQSSGSQGLRSSVSSSLFHGMLLAAGACAFGGHSLSFVISEMIDRPSRHAITPRAR